jgi:phytoene synthase
MEFEAKRAWEFFARAAEALPREDRQSMVAAEIMASIYRALLRRIESDKFRVFEKEYQLSKLEKAGRIAAQLLKARFSFNSTAKHSSHLRGSIR